MAAGDPAPADAGIATVFASVAHDRPSRLAVADDERRLTFGELRGLAGGVAARLHDTAAGTPVGVAAASVTDMAVGMLGSLFAGRPYVLLDTSASVAAQGEIISICGIGAAVGRSVPSGLGVPRITPDDVAPKDVELVSMPPDAVYSIALTSGSTGRPKRTPQQQSSFFASVYTGEHPARPVDDDYVAMTVSSAGFAGGEVLRTLLAGVSFRGFDARSITGRALSVGVREEGITLLNTVPTLLRRMLASTAAGETFPRLRLVRCSGEALLWSDVARARDHLASPCRIVNTYGTTEAGGIAGRVVIPAEESGTGVVPVGRSVRGVRIEILTANGTPVETGDVGEIVVAGPQMSQRYLDADPAVSPFEHLPDGTVRYWTGDLGRINADGELEHLGRRDRMVKVGGTRIEPAAVEDVLRRCEGVRDVAVTVVDLGEQERQLWAHVEVAPSRPRPTARVLREEALEALPPPSVPARFVLRDSPFPMLPSGKVDRAALIETAPERPEGDVPWVAPTGPLETSVAGVFREVLDVDDVGATDDFFLLGGDSLRAATLCELLLERTGVDLPPSVLLEASTAAQLARLIETEGDGAWRCVVPVREEGGLAPLFLAHGPDGNLMPARELVAGLDDQRPVYGLQVQGLGALAGLDVTLEDMASRYVSEIVATRPRGPYLLLGHDVAGLLALETARRLRASGHDVPLVILGDSPLPPARVVEDEAGVRDRIRRLYERAAVTLSASMGSPIPRSLRPAALRLACRRAFASSAVAPYDGRVALLRVVDGGAQTRESGPGRRWRSALGGPVDVVRVPSVHGSLLDDQAVGRLIEECMQSVPAYAEGSP